MILKLKQLKRAILPATLGLMKSTLGWTEKKFGKQSMWRQNSQPAIKKILLKVKNNLQLYLVCSNIIVESDRKEVLKMTVEEIKKRIEQLKNRVFLINMKDRWTNEDERRITEMENEIRELKLQIA